MSSLRLGELVRDMRNPNLSLARVDDIVRRLNEFGDNATKVEGWTRYADQNPFFDIIRARFGEFEVAPLDAMVCEKTSPVSVLNNTTTNMSIGRVTPDTKAFSTTGDATQIRLLQARGAIGVFGTVQWATNAVGRRGVHLDIYDNNDVFLSGITLHSLFPTGVASDTMPYSGYFLTKFLPTGTFFRFSVVQTSGGALNMEFFRAVLFTLI